MNKKEIKALLDKLEQLLDTEGEVKKLIEDEIDSPVENVEVSMIDIQPEDRTISVEYTYNVVRNESYYYFTKYKIEDYD